MFEAARDILLCLSLAAALGAAIGWLARGLRARGAAAENAARAHQAQEELRRQLSAVDALKRSADSTRQELDAVRAQAQATEVAQRADRAQLVNLQSDLAHQGPRLKDVEAERNAARVEASAAQGAAGTAQARVAEMEVELRVFRLENEQLAAKAATAVTTTRQQADTFRATLKAAEAGWDKSRAQAEAASEELSLLRQQLEASELERATLLGRLSDNQSLLLELIAKLDAAPLAALEPPPAAPAPQPRSPIQATPKPPRDDLRKIRGIGPVLEKTLHRLGVYRYAQIALWTREEALAVQQRLPGFHDRIMRDRWQTAARQLHVAKYGSPP